MERDLLMAAPSCSRAPVAPVESALSLVDMETAYVINECGRVVMNMITPHSSNSSIVNYPEHITQLDNHS